MSLRNAFSLKNKSWYLDLITLGIITGCLFFIFLGSRPLSIPDEGNYAEIIREMVEMGNYTTPYLNGIKFFEKPILLYWLGTMAIKIAGVNVWSVRSVNAILAILICLTTYITGRRLFNREVGFTAACILSTSILFFAPGHMLTTDMVVTAFITFTLFNFLLGIKATTDLKHFFYFSGAAICAGLAVLAKGLIGILLPMAIIGIWVFITRERQHLKNKYIPWCILLFLAIVLPWHLLVTFHNPEFWYFYFVKQHLLRFATNTVGHPQPFWYYFPVLFLGFFPWICFLPLAVKNSLKMFFNPKEKNQMDSFLLIWISFIILFFTIATSKLIAYILPAFPPMALLTANYLVSNVRNKNAIIQKGFFYLFLFSILISILLLFFPYYWGINNLKASIHSSQLAVSILFFGSMISYMIAKKFELRKAFISIVITMMIFLFILLLSLPAFDGQSIKPLTNILKTRLSKNDHVIAYNHHYQDLSFYLKRKIYILNSHKLFTYGMQFQDHHEWMIQDDTFKKLWLSQTRAFAFMRKEEYEDAKRKHPDYPFHLLGKTNINVLVSNQVV